MRRDQWWTAVALSLGLLLVAIPATRASGQSASPSNDVSVRGTVVARPGVDGGAVMLPDIEVFLRDVTGPETEPVLTDLDGRFRIALRAPGAHQICWRGQGWLADCEPAPITIADTIVPRRMVTIAPDLRDDSGQSFATVYGRVTLADGSPCRFTSPFFGVDFTATVRTRAAQGAVAAGLVRANTVGAYVLPRVPTTAVSVGAACDGADTDQAISRSGPTNVTIANATAGSSLSRAPSSSAMPSLLREEAICTIWTITGTQSAAKSLSNAGRDFAAAPIEEEPLGEDRDLHPHLDRRGAPALLARSTSRAARGLRG